MLLLNFGHPLTEAHLARIRELLAMVSLTPRKWQTTLLILNPPHLARITAVLFAKILGRCGDFPTVLRLSPVSGLIPTRHEAKLLAHKRPATKPFRIVHVLRALLVRGLRVIHPAFGVTISLFLHER